MEGALIVKESSREQVLGIREKEVSFFSQAIGKEEQYRSITFMVIFLILLFLLKRKTKV